MLVVSNTSPILNLAIIGKTALLRSQFPEILIPTVVFDELKTQSNRPGSAEINEALRACNINNLRQFANKYSLTEAIKWYSTHGKPEILSSHLLN